MDAVALPPLTADLVGSMTMRCALRPSAPPLLWQAGVDAPIGQLAYRADAERNQRDLDANPFP